MFLAVRRYGGAAESLRGACAEAIPRHAALLKLRTRTLRYQLLPLLFCVSGLAAQKPAPTDAVDRFIRAELARQRIPGMSVAILRGDSVLLARGYGFANLEHRVPATDSTVYAVGSLSKPFTAAAIVLLSVGIAGLVEPALIPPHRLASPLKGAAPPTSIEQLLRSVASGSESALVTPEFRATFPSARRQLIGGLLKGIDTWTPLGCERVRDRGIARLRSRIEHTCYAKGTGKQGSLLFTVLYGSDWRAAGLDNFFGI